MIYLAAPYTHPDPAVRSQRLDAVCTKAAEMLSAGTLVYCPLAHGYALSAHGLPEDWDFWGEHSEDMIERCTAVAVLAIDGWDTSVGVTKEISHAASLGIEVYILPETQAP